MSVKFKIASIPLRMVWADRDENLANVGRIMSALQPDSDLVVLPELFSTGFLQDIDVIRSLAEDNDGPTMRTVSKLASDHNVAIGGTFLCIEEGRVYNRGFIVEPSGERYFYDKRHLFSLSAEHSVFTQGTELPKAVRYRGWNLSMIVCYDLRFPAWCRNRDASSLYDIMIVPANWPTSRGFAWRQLLSARAIENQAIYVGANRDGCDDYGDYTDTTFIVNPLGLTISQKDASSGIYYAEVDKSELEMIRQKLPFGNDADDFELACRENKQ